MKHLLISAQLLIFVFVAKAQRSEIFAPDGKAIKGYDAVAFFKESKPVQGIDSLTYLYKNAQWSFSSRENLEALKLCPNNTCPSSADIALMELLKVTKPRPMQRHGQS